MNREVFVGSSCRENQWGVSIVCRFFRLPQSMGCKHVLISFKRSTNMKHYIYFALVYFRKAMGALVNLNLPSRPDLTEPTCFRCMSIVSIKLQPCWVICNIVCGALIGLRDVYAFWWACKLVLIGFLYINRNRMRLMYDNIATWNRLTFRFTVPIYSSTEILLLYSYCTICTNSICTGRWPVTAQRFACMHLV